MKNKGLLLLTVAFVSLIALFPAVKDFFAKARLSSKPDEIIAIAPDESHSLRGIISPSTPAGTPKVPSSEALSGINASSQGLPDYDPLSSVGKRLDPDDPANWPGSSEDSTESIGERLDPDDPANWPGISEASAESIGERLDPDDPANWPASGGKYSQSIGPRVDPDDPASWPLIEPSGPSDVGERLDPDDPVNW